MLEENDQHLQPEWGLQASDIQLPLWMVDEEFSVQSLNSWMASSLDPPRAEDNNASWLMSTPDVELFESHARQSSPRLPSGYQAETLSPESSNSSPKSTVSDVWFTRCNSGRSFVDRRGQPRPLAGSVLIQRKDLDTSDGEVDEGYRIHLAKQMRSRLSEDLMPSNDFLVSISRLHGGCPNNRLSRTCVFNSTFQK